MTALFLHLGITKPRARTKAWHRQHDQALEDRAKSAGNGESGGVDGHAFERSFWLCARVRRCDGSPGQADSRDGVACCSGAKARERLWRLPCSHKPTTTAQPKPRHPELEAGIKPGPLSPLPEPWWIGP